MESLKINTETTTLVDLVEESLLKYIKEKTGYFMKKNCRNNWE